MRPTTLAFLLVVGCGGGVSDGSNASTPPVPPSPPPTSTATPPAPGLTLDAALAQGRSLAVDDAHVFLASEQRSLARFPALLDATGAPLLAGYFGYVALDATSVYTVRDSRTIVRLPKGGGPEIVLTTLDTGAASGGVRVAGDNVYFLSVTTTGGLEHQVSHCALERVPAAGGAPTVLMTYDGCGDFVVDDHAVYALRDAELLVIPVDGSASSVLTTFAGADASYLSLAQDDTRLWAAALHGSHVFSVAKAGGAVAPRATTSGLPHSITVAGEDLYWLEIPTDLGGPAAADVMTATKSGGPPRRLLAGVVGAEAIAVNTDAVYSAGLGALHRVLRH